MWNLYVNYLKKWFLHLLTKVNNVTDTLIYNMTSSLKNYYTNLIIKNTIFNRYLVSGISTKHNNTLHFHVSDNIFKIVKKNISLQVSMFRVLPPIVISNNCIFYKITNKKTRQGLEKECKIMRMVQSMRGPRRYVNFYAHQLMGDICDTYYARDITLLSESSSSRCPIRM